MKSSTWLCACRGCHVECTRYVLLLFVGDDACLSASYITVAIVARGFKVLAPLSITKGHDYFFAAVLMVAYERFSALPTTGDSFGHIKTRWAGVDDRAEEVTSSLCCHIVAEGEFSHTGVVCK